MKKICILLLILYSISIAKFFPAYYNGYQKITKSIALQQLENPLFNNPVDAAIMSPGNVRVTFIVDEGWHRVVYTKENQDDWIKVWVKGGRSSHYIRYFQHLVTLDIFDISILPLSNFVRLETIAILST
ncbi:unnamed protein product [marine sediment metagenome]|uniref:Uncharacterized protein n=1 Tax=marine sediment metagenome TaxID=412755 RepID=X1JE49_9ZZZZ